MQRRALLAAVGGGLAAAPAFSQSQAWPNRPIRLIIPYPPGVRPIPWRDLLRNGCGRGLVRPW